MSDPTHGGLDVETLMRKHSRPEVYESTYRMRDGVTVVARRGRGRDAPHELRIPTDRGTIVLKRGEPWPSPAEKAEWDEKVSPLLARELDRLAPDRAADLEHVRAVNRRL